MTEDPFDVTRIAPRATQPPDDATRMVTPRVDDATQLARPRVDDATQLAAPRVLEPKSAPSVDSADVPLMELPREHYGIRQAPVGLPPAEPPSTMAHPGTDVTIPVLDVEGAAARVRRVRLWGVIGLVATMVAVVLVAGFGLAALL